MRCPRCNEDNDRVVDSRMIKEGASVSRYFQEREEK